MSRPKRSVTKKALRYEILTFVEGDVTEEQYLKHYHRLHRSKVNVEVADFRGAPLSLVKNAIDAKKRERREERRNRGRAHDEIWCVFDVDEHPDLAQAASLARDHDIHLAISSPCIELWFVIHFQEQTAYLHRHDAQSLSRDHLECDKHLSKDALASLQHNFETAKDRAIRLDAKHSGDDSGANANPSSNVWGLVDAISTGTCTP